MKNVFSTLSKRSSEGFAIIAPTKGCLYFGPTVVLAFFHCKAYRPVADTFVQSAPASQTPS